MNKNKKKKNIPAIICGVVAGVSLFGIFGGIAIKNKLRDNCVHSVGVSRFFQSSKIFRQGR